MLPPRALRRLSWSCAKLRTLGRRFRDQTRCPARCVLRTHTWPASSHSSPRTAEEGHSKPVVRAVASVWRPPAIMSFAKLRLRKIVGFEVRWSGGTAQRPRSVPVRTMRLPVRGRRRQCSECARSSGRAGPVRRDVSVCRLVSRVSVCPLSVSRAGRRRAACAARRAVHIPWICTHAMCAPSLAITNRRDSIAQNSSATF